MRKQPDKPVRSPLVIPYESLNLAIHAIDIQIKTLQNLHWSVVAMSGPKFDKNVLENISKEIAAANKAKSDLSNAYVYLLTGRTDGVVWESEEAIKRRKALEEA